MVLPRARRVRGRAGVAASGSEPREAPVLLEDLAVRVQHAAGAEVADEVPVQGGDVRAAGLGVRPADGGVDGAADLLVEEDHADRAVDAEVRADADLAEEPRPVVRRERALEVVRAALGPVLDDLGTSARRP
jgi:hypothetical protein